MEVLKIILAALSAAALSWVIPSFVLLHSYKRINKIHKEISEVKDQLIARQERLVAELEGELALAVKTPNLLDFKRTKEELETYKRYFVEECRKRKGAEKAFVALGGDLDSLRKQSEKEATDPRKNAGK